MKIHKGDTVKVISGKSKGLEGEVQRVNKKDNTVLVENVNVVKRHLKPTKQREGGIIKMNRPINASNVMVICPKTSKPTRVAYSVVDGKKYRVSKKSGEIIKKS